MPKSKAVFPYFFLICASVGAQTSFTQRLEGKVVHNVRGVTDVHVMNTTASKATITDAEGNFAISVKLNDTLLFSAVQFKRKSLVVTAAILQSKTIFVPLEDFVNELDEVVVKPYDLSGDISKDMKNLRIGQVVSASTLGLPNANVKPLMQSERLLREASMGPLTLGTFISVPFNPIINAITGRTKMLKKRVARDKKYLKTQDVRKFYADSLFITQLKIPREKIDDFMYFCEVDVNFDSLVNSDDVMAIWTFLSKKSTIYRENNELD